MTVIRIKKTENFVILHKGALEDARLSFKAKGLWAYCMSKPSDWTFHVKQLARSNKEGEDAIYSAIKELMHAGYVEKIQGNEKGKFGPLDYIFHEVSQRGRIPAELKKCLPLRGFPDAGFPLADNPALLSNDSSLSIEEGNKKESAMPPLSIAAPISIQESNAEKETPKEAAQLAQDLVSKVKGNHPTLKDPDLLKWGKEIELINRRDNRTWIEIKEMMDWAFENAFWVKVIQSPASLRKHWDKMMIQRLPISNKGTQIKRNREIANEVKSVLIKDDKGSFLWIGSDFVRNTQTSDSINFDLPCEQFESILCKWFKLRKS